MCSEERKDPISEQEFKKMPFSKRYRCLKEEGEHITSRNFGGYEVYLFLYEGLYVEVWTYIALRQIIWIEPLRNMQAWEEYLDRMELPDDPTR